MRIKLFFFIVLYQSILLGGSDYYGNSEELNTVEELKAFLAFGGDNVHRYLRDIVMHWLAAHGSEGQLRKMLQKNEPIARQDIFGFTPLHHAVMHAKKNPNKGEAIMRMFITQACMSFNLTEVAPLESSWQHLNVTLRFLDHMGPYGMNFILKTSTLEYQRELVHYLKHDGARSWMVSSLIYAHCDWHLKQVQSLIRVKDSQNFTAQERARKLRLYKIDLLLSRVFKARRFHDLPLELQGAIKVGIERRLMPQLGSAHL